MKLARANPDVTFNLSLRLVALASVGGYLALIFGLHFITPPGRLPHLFQAGIALYSFVHFILFTMYFHYTQITDGRKELKQQKSSTKKKQ